MRCFSGNGGMTQAGNSTLNALCSHTKSLNRRRTGLLSTEYISNAVYFFFFSFRYFLYQKFKILPL